MSASTLPTAGSVVVLTADGRIVCEHCVIADTACGRLRGLLGRNRLLPGEGLWIRPTTSIHMFFMRFAIDAVFLDREDAVIAVVERLKPWRTATRREARSVLELAAGEAARRGVAVGHRLQLSASRRTQEAPPEQGFLRCG